MKRQYHLKRDSYDPRDYQFTARAGLVVPKSVDLSAKCSAVEDQGELGSCTGNAIVGAMEYLENLNNEKFVDLSRLFVYYNERYIEGTVKSDSGAEIRDGIKSVAQWGVCTEALCPYVISKFRSRPTAAAFHDAYARRSVTYSRVSQTVLALTQCLASGFPVVVGIQVYASFESDAVAKSGKVPMPAPKEQLLGGHAVLVVGYDLNTKLFKVRNSWGDAWGDHGYFYLPFDYLTHTALSSDFWAIQK